MLHHAALPGKQCYYQTHSSWYANAACTHSGRPEWKPESWGRAALAWSADRKGQAECGSPSEIVASLPWLCSLKECTAGPLHPLLAALGHNLVCNQAVAVVGGNSNGNLRDRERRPYNNKWGMVGMAASQRVPAGRSQGNAAPYRQDNPISLGNCCRCELAHKGEEQCLCWWPPKKPAATGDHW